MGDMELGLIIFCNQETLSVEGMGHQPRHKNFDLACKVCWGTWVGQPVSTTICDPCHERESMTVTGGPGIRGWTALRARIEQTRHKQTTKNLKKKTLKSYYCLHRTVSYDNEAGHQIKVQHLLVPSTGVPTRASKICHHWFLLQCLKKHACPFWLEVLKDFWI